MRSTVVLLLIMLVGMTTSTVAGIITIQKQRTKIEECRRSLRGIRATVRVANKAAVDSIRAQARLKAGPPTALGRSFCTRVNDTYVAEWSCHDSASVVCETRSIASDRKMLRVWRIESGRVWTEYVGL